jgi:hypothetical protein
MTVPVEQRGARRQLFVLILPVLIVFTVALSACGPGLPVAPDNEAGADAEGAEEGLTEPFQDFLDIMSQRGQAPCTETGAGGYAYNLECGTLSVSGAGGAVLWQSDPGRWVDGFRLGDVDGDGVEDFVFSLWKSYRFGKASPARMGNDDETVRNHLFVYTALSGHVKPIWGSSDLPCPVYSFELDPSGRVTPVSSGMLLRTREGEYRDDFSQTEATEHIYAWEKWGFVPIE